MVRVTPKDYEEAAEKFNVTLLRGEEIKPGDLYLAGRQFGIGIKLLTCHSVDKRNWINPVENEYNYDTHECVKVKKKE